MHYSVLTSFFQDNGVCRVHIVNCHMSQNNWNNLVKKRLSDSRNIIHSKLLCFSNTQKIVRRYIFSRCGPYTIKSVLICNILCNSIICNSLETRSSRYNYPYCPNNICQKLCFQNHLFLKHPYPLGSEEIVPPDKAYSLLTGRLDYSLTAMV